MSSAAAVFSHERQEFQPTHNSLHFILAHLSSTFCKNNNDQICFAVLIFLEGARGNSQENLQERNVPNKHCEVAKGQTAKVVFVCFQFEFDSSQKNIMFSLVFGKCLANNSLTIPNAVQTTHHLGHLSPTDEKQQRTTHKLFATTPGNLAALMV